MRAVVPMAILATLVIGTPAAAQDDIPSSSVEDIPYRIASETTRITGPLRNDGRLDFYAAMNQRMSEDVTPENNAARFILGTLPDEYGGLTHEEYQALRQKIDAEWLPMGHPQVVPIPLFVAENDCKDWLDRLYAGYEQVWDPDNQPVLAAYVEANTDAIDAIVAATNLEMFYVPRSPMNPESSFYDQWPEGQWTQATKASLLASEMQHIQSMRQLARLVLTRAMMRTSLGQYDEAWADIVAVRQLGKLLGQQPTLLEGLVGISVSGLACEAARNLIEFAISDEATALPPNWQHLADSWGKSVPTAQLEISFDLGERLFLLELVTLLADNKIGLTDTIALRQLMPPLSENAVTESLNETLKRLNEQGQLDWNEGMRWTNTFFDRLVEIARMPDEQLQWQETEKVEEKIRRLEESLVPAGLLKLGTDAPPGDKAKVVCGLLVAIFAPASGQINHANGRVLAFDKVIGLTLATLQFHQEHGRYPESKKDLADRLDVNTMFADFQGNDFEFEATEEGFRIWYFNQRTNQEFGFFLLPIE